jgi:hypothetical protein
MASNSGIQKNLFCHTKMIVFPEDYFAIRLPMDSKTVLSDWFRPATTRFAIFFRDPREIHLVVSRRKWLRMQSIFPKRELSGPMKVICFDPKLSKSIPDYMYAIGKILVENKLNAIPVSSLSRDHLLVPKSELPKAIKLFRKFMASCKKEAAKKRSK